jgi:hypothetical protein
MMRRRGLIAGLGALLAAPAIIRTPGLLMPVKPVVLGRMLWPEPGTGYSAGDIITIDEPWSNVYHAWDVGGSKWLKWGTA